MRLCVCTCLCTQNTGGFFIALLRKTARFGSAFGSGALPEASMTHKQAAKTANGAGSNDQVVGMHVVWCGMHVVR